MRQSNGGFIIPLSFLSLPTFRPLLLLRQTVFSVILLMGFCHTPVYAEQPKLDLTSYEFSLEQLAYTRKEITITPAPEPPKPPPKTPQVTFSVPKATPIPPEEVKRLIDRYFPEHARSAAYAIAKCESGWRSNAVGDGHLQYWQNGIQYGASYGIFQIRYLAGRPAPEQLLDPEFNVRYASNLYNSSGWRPWTCKKVL